MISNEHKQKLEKIGFTTISSGDIFSFVDYDVPADEADENGNFYGFDLIAGKLTIKEGFSDEDGVDLKLIKEILEIE